MLSSRSKVVSATKKRVFSEDIEDTGIEMVTQQVKAGANGHPATRFLFTGTYDKVLQVVKRSNILYQNQKKERKFGKQKLSEYESLSAALHRLLLPENVPMTRTFYNKEDLSRVGIISEKVSELTLTASNLASVFKKDGNTQLLGFMFALAVFLEENDLHLNNFGVNKSNDLIRFDFDRCLWTLTSKYHMSSKSGREVRIERDNIQNFPLNFSASRWAPKDPAFSRELFKNVSALIAMREAGNRAFLFLLLLPESILSEIVGKYITSSKGGEASNERARNKVLSYLNKRKNNLVQALSKAPSFSNFLERHAPKEHESYLNEMWATYLGSENCDVADGTQATFDFGAIQSLSERLKNLSLIDEQLGRLKIDKDGISQGSHDLLEDHFTLIVEAKTEDKMLTEVSHLARNLFGFHGFINRKVSDKDKRAYQLRIIRRINQFKCGEKGHNISSLIKDLVDTIVWVNSNKDVLSASAVPTAAAPRDRSPNCVTNF